MKRFILAAGVAALAITMPVAADPGGKGGKKGQSAKVERGGGKAQARGERRGGNREARAERRGGNREARNERRSSQRVARADRDNDDRRRIVRVRDRDDDRRRVVRIRDRDDDRRRFVRVRDRDDDRRHFVRVRDRDDDRRRVVRVRDRDRAFVGIRGHDGYWSNPGIGCPPGLSKKPWCMPPGQLKKHNRQLIGQLLPAAYRDRTLPLRLRDYYRDDDRYYYRYGDGYAYRVNRQTNLVAALLPLLGGGLGLGQMFPTSYNNSYVPDYYRSFYPDNRDDYYRYSNGYVYEIDRRTGLIEDIIPQFGYGYGMGQMLPAGYSHYNVPYQYRSMYPQTDDHYYRYAPGAIYQVDRSSNLITAVASLLAGDLAVGQRLPMGYSAYNVPLGYRDQYYDTADNMYRYNDGNIYRVDPTTQLITAVIRAIV